MQSNYAIMCFLLLVFASTSIASFVTTPLTIPLLEGILMSNITRSKRMPHPTEFFLDMEKYYYILLVITFVGYAVCGIIVIATDTIYFALLQHTCGTLAILRYSNFALIYLSIYNKIQFYSYVVYDYILTVIIWLHMINRKNVLIPHLKEIQMLTTWCIVYNYKSE